MVKYKWHKCQINRIDKVCNKQQEKENERAGQK